MYTYIVCIKKNICKALEISNHTAHLITWDTVTEAAGLISCHAQSAQAV